MNTAVITNQSDGGRFEQSATDTVLQAALRAGIGLSYECNSGGCGACKFELLDGQVTTLWDKAPGLSERDRKRGRHLACQCRAEGEVVIKAATSAEYVAQIRPVQRLAKLVAVADITHDIREFSFQCEGAAEFMAGQYALLTLPGVGSYRAYSMSNTANPQGIWQFQVRRIPTGKGSNVLFGLPIGSAIELDAPYGNAYLREDAAHDIVCVAGGSGLAPMVSVARAAAAIPALAQRQLYFFYGARTESDVCGIEFLQDLANFAEHIHYIPVVSEPGAHWQGEKGWVHEAVARLCPLPLSQYQHYFAGPPPMTEALQSLLMIDHQVPFQQLHFDRFF